MTKDDDGQLMGCHATKADAQKQVAALHANEESDVSSMTGVDPRSALRLCQRSVEFRPSEPVGDGRTLEGYAAVFDAPTVIESFAGDFEEVVKRGAFRRTLGTRTPVMQFDHGNDKRTGSTPIGAIKDIHEDDQGLFVRARLFDNDLVEPIRQAIEGRAVRGMSFKFRVMADAWVDRDGTKIAGDELADLLDDPGDRGPIRREILEVDLFELGPVVFPAYTQTSVGVRNSPFDPGQLALRGVIAQFGLDSRCIRRHLALFDADARAALAAEIAETFPELRDALVAAEPTSDPPAAAGVQTSAGPADVGTPAAKPSADPAYRHSADLWEPADWYLPESHEVL